MSTFCLGPSVLVSTVGYAFILMYFLYIIVHDSRV